MKHFKKINQLLRSLAMLLCIVLLLPLLPVLPASAEDPSLAAEGSAEGEVTVVCEDESKRTAFEKHYLLSDGTYYAVSYAEAVHEQDEQGKWVDAHSAPVYDEDEDAYLVKGKGYRASFGLSQNKAALVNKKGQALCWHYELIGYEDEKAVMKLEKKNAKAQGGKNASPKGKKVGDKDAFALPEAQGELLFEDAFSALGAEVRYTVSPQKIKEDVILNEKGRVYALSMVIENCGYKARLEDGAVIFEDNKGNDYFYVDAPLMYDAAGESSTAVQVLLKQTGKTVTVTYTPDKAWLDAPERVYPVTFDPAVTTEDYAANMEDGQLLLAKGSVCNTTNNRMAVGKAGGVEARGVIYIATLPHTGNLPIIQASLHLPTYGSASSSVSGNTLILEEISYTGALNELTSDTTVTPVSQVGTAAIAQGDTSYTFNVLTASLLEKGAANQSICYRLRLQTVPSSGALNLGTTEQSTASKRPVLTVRYGYQNPSFVGEQIFLNNNYASIEDRKILKLHGTTLSMVNYNQWEARASMTLEEGANGGVYIYANYETRYLTAALSENNSYPAANDAVIGSDMVTSSNSSSVEKAEFVFTPLANGKYMIQLLSNPRLVLTRTANGLKLYNISSINTEQSWIITNIGDEIKTDGTVLKSGIYYINNLSSRTFMVLNTSTATTPILKAGTEEALGDKMAWNIRAIGGGYYMIESVLRPGYYLTCSSSSVAVEFLSGYETVPSKAKFTAVPTSDGYAFKSGTNQYLAKSSPAFTTLSTATSASSEQARWRVCLKEEYIEQTAHRFFYTQVQTTQSVNIESSLSDANTTWASLEDFLDFEIEYDEYVTIDNNGTITGLKSGYERISAVHIPTNSVVEIGVYVYAPEDTKTQRMTRDVDGESTYCVVELYNGQKLWFVRSDDGACSNVYTLNAETWDWLDTNYTSFVSNSGSPLSTEYCVYQAKQKIDLQMQNGGLYSFSPTSDEYHGLWLHFSLVECNFREDLCHYLNCVEYVTSCLDITNTLIIQAYNISTYINTVYDLTQSQYRAAAQTVQILGNITNTQAVTEGITDIITYTGSRPTWRESELYVFSTMYTPEDGYCFNPSYKLDENGNFKSTYWGDAGSVRPDMYNSITGHCVDVKNYTVTTSNGRNSLVNNVVSQYNKRCQIFPSNTSYEVVIDVRGQSWIQTDLDNISQRILTNTNGNMLVTFLT